MYTEAMALYRAQILLEEDQHSRLERLARESGRSMSQLMREIVAEHLARASEDETVRLSLAALDDLARLRNTVARKHGILSVRFLDELRDERDDEVVG